MTYLLNDPDDFMPDMKTGFARAHSALVREVRGGFVRTGQPTESRVAVVTGGGSGHYPAFAGFVGEGLAHGAALGNVFASPSAIEIYSVAKAAENGAGVMFVYGNYAGDVLNFTQAQEQLLAEGIPCRSIAVSDDIASATAVHGGRGLAGDLFVLKAAGVAADRGSSLDEVWRVARRTNERTRTLGVAFGGCTLPGAHAPLFTIPVGRVGVGVGIHGESGLWEQELPTAKELADILTGQLLSNVPSRDDANESRRVAVLVNGLGSVKYEELYVLYGEVARRLESAGLVIVGPDVGEYVTSFQMAGVSLSLCWLDEEIEGLWSESANAAGYRKSVATNRDDAEYAGLDEREAVVPAAGASSQESAAIAVTALVAVAGALRAAAEDLGRLDAVAGDGDHGIGMHRGSAAAERAARQSLSSGAGLGTVLRVAGEAWAERAGGTSGALWGAILRAIGVEVGDATAPTAEVLAGGVRAAAVSVQRLGGAQIGDKTMLDVLLPFSEALQEATRRTRSVSRAWRESVSVATTSASSTAHLLPKIGRARPHAEKSVGTPDPGAVSMSLVISTVSNVLDQEAGS